MKPALLPALALLPTLLKRSLGAVSHALFACSLLGAPDTAQGKAAWKPLFNGKSFRPEWRFVGDSTFWTIDPADTSIVGLSATNKTPHALLFTTKADYDQFTVKYAYRLKAGCSGFWFRTRGTTATNVEGPQVEIKRENNELLEVGSIYTWPTPGWEVQHSRAYSIKTAPKADDYQDVVLTVKRPNIYVNVNGSQAIGETDPAGITAGAKAAWNYTNSNYVKNPGSFALQVHEGYAIDIRFKNIMILEGCGDSASANYDGRTVAGLPKQPAVYQDNGTCTGAGVAPESRKSPAADIRAALARALGVPRRAEGSLRLDVDYPGPHSLEVLSLDGRSLFTGSAPEAHAYRLSGSLRGGVFVVRLSAGGQRVSRRMLLP